MICITDETIFIWKKSYEIEDLGQIETTFIYIGLDSSYILSYIKSKILSQIHY